MKINNIAIAGIFVTIFGLIETANATTIASQAYVDAKDGLKQDKLTSASGGNVSVDNTSNTAASRAVTGITATNGVLTFTTQPIAAGITASDVVDDGTGSNTALQLTNDAKAPSVRSIKAAKTTTNLVTRDNTTGLTTVTGGDDNHFITSHAVADSIKTLDHATLANSSNASTAVTAVTQVDGQVRVTNGTLGAAAIGETESRNVVSSRNGGYLAGVGGVQEGVLYMKGNSVANMTASATPTAEDSWTVANGTDDAIKAIRDAKGFDQYVPTVAAVEARAQALQAYAQSVANTAASGVAVTTTNTKSATWDSSNNTLTVASSGDGASTTKVATPKQVANTITDVKSYIDYKASGALARKDAVGSSEITNLSIINEDISTSAAIDFSKMNDGLKDVNSSSADGNCTAGSPCVLTFYKVGSTKYYKWTNLDTESTNAVPNS